MCDRVFEFVRKVVEKDHEVVKFDPLKWDLPQTQQSMNWLMNPSAVPDNIKDLNRQVSECDALIALTAEYNYCIPPALSNLVDNCSVMTFTWKPCAIISYSMSTIGGWRGGLQVRQLMGAVGCSLIQKQMGIPVVHETLGADGKPSNDKLDTELNSLLKQLYWLTRAINTHKAVEEAPQHTM